MIPRPPGRLWRSSWLVLVLAAGVCLTAASGCGGTRTTVEGTVKVKGKDLQEGGVTFHLPTAGERDLKPAGPVVSGTFTLYDTPPGEYKVTVESSKVKIPAKYRDPKQTPLTASIKAGKNTLPTFNVD